MSREREYYDALKKIAREYKKSEWFTDDRAEKSYGLSGNQALEMAYDNMQQEAENAIRGRRRP
jgi:hypothetical protein